MRDTSLITRNYKGFNYVDHPTLVLIFLIVHRLADPGRPAQHRTCKTAQHNTVYVSTHTACSEFTQPSGYRPEQVKKTTSHSNFKDPKEPWKYLKMDRICHFEAKLFFY